jgi:hypothetical protein
MQHHLSERQRLKDFINRRRSGGTIIESNGRYCLDVRDPATLADFFAFCKTVRRGRGRHVFLRGHGQHHTAMVPTLFRTANDASERATRWAGYREFLQHLPALVEGTRFTRRNFGAVLQHYGFHTPWLDVVDDLHAAIWFALHDFTNKGGQCIYRLTKRPHGWIAVISTPRGPHVQNLREQHSSMNTRCNVQQGYSLAMQYDNEEAPSRQHDFIASVIHMVRIPTSKPWQPGGYRGSAAYFFPSREQDDTYRQLLNPAVDAAARQAEKKHSLDDGVLGSVGKYD